MHFCLNLLIINLSSWKISDSIIDMLYKWYSINTRWPLFLFKFHSLLFFISYYITKINILMCCVFNSACVILYSAVFNHISTISPVSIPLSITIKLLLLIIVYQISFRCLIIKWGLYIEGVDKPRAIFIAYTLNNYLFLSHPGIPLIKRIGISLWNIFLLKL